MADTPLNWSKLLAMVVIDELLILELERKWARSLCARYKIFLFTKLDPIIALHAHLPLL